MSEAVEPIQKSIKAKGHTAQYRMHKYYARRPYNVFRNLIFHYTDQGDIVLDPFCGGGVTVFESLAIYRKAIGVDLNPLGTFITEMQLKQVNLNDLREFLNNFLEEMKSEYQHFYEYEIENNKVYIEWVEWAYKVSCPYCKTKIILSKDNKISPGIYECSNPECEINNSNRKGVRRVDTIPDSKFPLRIKYRVNDSEKIHELNEKEANKIIEKTYKDFLPENYVDPNKKIPDQWDRIREDCLPEKGINEFKDLFTERNYTLNLLFFNKILKYKNKIDIEKEFVDILFFVFSASLRYTNNMTRIIRNWANGNPTSMDKHAYYLPNQFVENNVFMKFENRINAIIKGLKHTNETLTSNVKKAKEFENLKNDKDYMVLNRDSSDLPLPDKSVDAIITDPPYGSNVQYAELSSFWNIWLKHYKDDLETFIKNEEEAVVNRKDFEGSKGISHYEEKLYEVYSECNRVLKDNGFLVFTFNNKKLKVWIALLNAIAKSGFYLPENGVVFQDYIEEYKNTSHLKYSGNIQGDFIYSFKKGEPQVEADLDNISFDKYIKQKIGKTLDDLFEEKSGYTTAKLYQNIFSSITNTILKYAIANSKDDYDELIKVEDISGSFIENYLNTNLHYDEDNEIWVR